MALVFTEVGLQAELEALRVAVAANDRTAALAACVNVGAVLTGLPKEVRASDTTTKLATDFEKLKNVVESWAMIARASDRRRLIRTGVSYRTNSRRSEC